jgi:WD40 repeat protein
MIVLQGHRARVEHVAFAPDGAALFAPTWQGIQVWRPFVAGGSPKSLAAPHTHYLHFTPNGNSLFAVAYALYHADLTSGVVTELAEGGRVIWFALSHGGNWYIADERHVGREVLLAARATAGTVLWQRSGAGWWGRPLILPGDEEFIAVVREGQTHRERKLRIATYRAATGDEVRRSAPLASEVREWTLSPDGSLVACWYTVWVHVYPLRGSFDRPLATLRNDNRKEFTGIAFHPSGRYLAATSNDKTVKMYDTQTWEVARTFTWNIGRMRSVAFSPDGALAAAGSDTGKVVVWDVDL